MDEVSSDSESDEIIALMVPGGSAGGETDAESSGLPEQQSEALHFAFDHYADAEGVESSEADSTRVEERESSPQEVTVEEEEHPEESERIEQSTSEDASNSHSAGDVATGEDSADNEESEDEERAPQRPQRTKRPPKIFSYEEMGKPSYSHRQGR